MQDVRLEDIIRSYVPLPPYPNSKGWFSVLCKVCNDHGRKGPRAAFKFEGDAVGYNCFNCGHTAAYDPDKDESMHKDMVTVLNDFGIPETEWQQVLMTSLARRHENGSQKNSPKRIHTNIEPDELKLPDHFYPLDSAEEDDKWAIIARDYLEFTRGVDPSSYPFYLSTGGNDKYTAKWKGRLIIPVYKDNKLIYYQGRALASQRKKYESPNEPKDKVLYGFDELNKNTELPIYVVEGWFDAFAIGGVAVYGNRLTDAQIKWLNRSRRPKIVIPDRFGDGHMLAEHALELGWSVSIPDIGNCKDMSDAVKRFGKLYVMKSIVENTLTGFAAEAHVQMLCKYGQNTSKGKS